MEFTLKDLLYVLSEYDVRHIDDPTQKSYGNCSGEFKRINVYHPQGQKETMDTCLHEMIHARSAQLCLNLTEKEVKKMAKDITRKLDLK